MTVPDGPIDLLYEISYEPQLYVRTIMNSS
jgi:hypothetical protein